MKPLTIGRILREYKEFLTEAEIEDLSVLQTEKDTLAGQTKRLHLTLFSEEYDEMWDSLSEIKDRDKGINPMLPEYTERMNKKRAAFGVTPLNEAGRPVDLSAYRFCEEVVRHTRNYTEYLDAKSGNTKQVVFVDMDNVLVDFQSGIDKIPEEDKKKYEGHLDDVPGIFSLMEPYEGAIEGYTWLCKHFDTYILSTAPWDNPSAWTDKLHWVKKHLPDLARKRLILSHNKHLLRGDYLIDDRRKNGADRFQGKHIHFAKEGGGFEDWKAVTSYLKNLT